MHRDPPGCVRAVPICGSPGRRAPAALLPALADASRARGYNAAAPGFPAPGPGHRPANPRRGDGWTRPPLAAAAASLRGNHAVVAPAARGGRGSPAASPGPAPPPALTLPVGSSTLPRDRSSNKPRSDPAFVPPKNPVSIPCRDLVPVPQRHRVLVPWRDPVPVPPRDPAPVPQSDLAPLSRIDGGVYKAILVHTMVHLNQGPAFARYPLASADQ